MTSLSKVFQSAIDHYLDSTLPKYARGHFNIVEESFQYRFLRKLSHAKMKLQIEELYPGNSGKKYDILAIPEDGVGIYIELEWSAKLTDGFGKHTFGDFWKLHKYTPKDARSAFFAVNISNKWTEFPERWKTYKNASDLPNTSYNTALQRLWNSPDFDDYREKCILKIKRYDQAKKGNYNIVLFSYVNDTLWL